MLIATNVRSPALLTEVTEVLRGRHEVVVCPGWSDLVAHVRSEPVVTTVVDLAALSSEAWASDPIRAFRREFPHQGLVVLLDRGLDARLIFELGRRRVPELLFVRSEQLSGELLPSLYHSIRGGAAARVVRALSPFLPGPEIRAVVSAMDDVRRTWDAEAFAARQGYTRPFLSERFKRRGLPALGAFLLWCRILHAATWLCEPGRTGQSVGRQLGYADGAGFRRALRGCTGLTPTEVARRGGLGHVLRIFMELHGFVRGRRPEPTQGASLMIR